MWCWRRMEKISWTDHVRNEKVLLRIKEQRIILHEISKRKSKWIGHILRRNCLLQRVIEGKIKGGIEVTRRRGRRRRKLLDGLKEKSGISQLKEEALDRYVERSLWKRLWTCLRQTAVWMISDLCNTDVTIRHLATKSILRTSLALALWTHTVSRSTLLNIHTATNWLTVKFHHSKIGPKLKYWLVSRYWLLIT